MNKKMILIIAFIIMVIVQLAVPASMIIEYERTLKTGKQFKFRTEPVDPYDAFRGRYVALSIESNEVSVNSQENFKPKQKVYAYIKNGNDGFAVIDKISTEIPDGQDYLKTTINYKLLPNKVKLNLPFDRYYMEEKSAPLAEQAYIKHSNRKTRDAYIIVRVLSGNSVIEYLFIGGKPVHEYIKQEGTEKK